MESAPFAGTSPAPKHGPQNAERMLAPLAISLFNTPFCVSAIIIGWLAG